MIIKSMMCAHLVGQRVLYVTAGGNDIPPTREIATDREMKERKNMKREWREGARNILD
jgi:hypothetical protein